MSYEGTSLRSERADRFGAVMALSSMGLWELHTSGARLEWSRTVALLHGHGEEEAAPPLEVFLAHLTPVDREAMISAVLGGSREAGRTIVFSYQWLVDGQVRYLRAHCVAEIDAEGTCSGLVGSVQDVTNDMVARVELVRATETSAAASQIKSQFLANMSHEIRTPMNAVLGMTSLLLETELSPQQREYAVAAKASGDALLGLINDILDLSKIEAGKLVLEERTFGVRAVVGGVLAALDAQARRKGVALVAHVDASVPPASIGDPLRIRQVLTNLVSNAVKFTAAGEIHACVRQDGELLRLSVRDTGVGIAPEALAVIFEPFRQADGATTRRFGGTGLGLSIAKELVECMGGSITVASEVGRGSMFEASIRAPASGEASEPTVPPGTCVERAAPALVAPPPPRLLVLVAEDDDTNALLTNALLTKMGHTVVRARDGAEAAAAASTERFDLIFMDVQMPALDGFEATARIRARELESGRHVPIIALTANAMKGDDERCVGAGMDAYLSKPVDAAGLRDALHRWGRSDPEDALT